MVKNNLMFLLLRLARINPDQSKPKHSMYTNSHVLIYVLYMYFFVMVRHWVVHNIVLFVSNMSLLFQCNPPLLWCRYLVHVLNVELSCYYCVVIQLYIELQQGTVKHLLIVIASINQRVQI